MFAALREAYDGEAIFRPSNAARWMSCPGSVQRIARMPRIPQPVKAPARQGSAAHTLAELVLTDSNGLTPEDYVGRYIAINGDPTDLYLVDEEMGEKITDYVAIAEGLRSIPGTELFIEHKLSLGVLDPTDPLLHECRGTADVVAVNREQRWIVDLDLKYGKGIPVDGDSPQLKIYLAMALLAFRDEKPWIWGGTTIFQPRLPVPPYTEDDHYKPFVFKPAEVFGDFLTQVIAAIHAALAPEPKLEPSIKNCYWCEARPLCPAARAAALSCVQDNQPMPSHAELSAQLGPIPEIIQQPPGQTLPAVHTAGKIVLRSPSDHNVAQIRDTLLKINMLEVWAAGYKHYASQLLQAGIAIPDWYLKSRTGNRRWSQPREVVEAELLKLKLKPADIYTEPKLRSPKQVEDRLPKLLKGAIEHLYERPPGAPTLMYGVDPEAKPVLSAMPGPIEL